MNRTGLLIGILLLVCASTCAACGGTGRESAPPRRLPETVAGQADSTADRVYRVLGTPGDTWVARSSTDDPVLDLDTRVRMAAHGVVDAAHFADISGQVEAVNTGTMVARWTFPDHSVLIYTWALDVTHQRARIESVEVERP